MEQARDNPSKNTLQIKNKKLKKLKKMFMSNFIIKTTFDKGFFKPETEKLSKFCV